MKNGIIKIVKGFIAISTIKLLLFGLVFLNQACQLDDNNNLFLDSDKEVALKNFEKLLLKKTPAIQRVVEVNRMLLVPGKSNFRGKQDNIEENVKNQLLELVLESKELFKVYGVNENDVSDEFEDINDPRIALVGLLIFATETKKSEIAFNLGGLLGEPTYGMNQQWECIMEAIGLPGGMIAGGMKKMTIKSMLKSAAKLAGRALGWVGLAWAVADYTSCMGYW